MRVVRDIVVPDESEFKEAQANLALEITLGDQFRYVAGVDVAYSADGTKAFAAAAVLSTTNWSVVHSMVQVTDAHLPYDREMLSFRDGPAAVGVLSKLSVIPDLILVADNGIAHPRKFGAACHVGLSFDRPTVGITQIFPNGCLRQEAQLSRRRGSRAALVLATSKEKVGHEVYTQDNMEVAYVSPGHRLSVDEATSLALRCSPWGVMPEPLLRSRDLAAELRDNSVLANAR